MFSILRGVQQKRTKRQEQEQLITERFYTVLDHGGVYRYQDGGKTSHAPAEQSREQEETDCYSQT